MDERPVAAPWMFDNLPWLAGLWGLAGRRNARRHLPAYGSIDANDSNLVPPLIGLWQPNHPTDAAAAVWRPRCRGRSRERPTSPSRWSARSCSPTDIRSSRRLARPSGQVNVTLSGPSRAGDRRCGGARSAAVRDRRAGRPRASPRRWWVGRSSTGGSVLGWLQAILRELGRVWLVALALVAAARLARDPVRAEPAAAACASQAGPLSDCAARLSGWRRLMLAGLVSTYLLDRCRTPSSRSRTCSRPR